MLEKSCVCKQFLDERTKCDSSLVGSTAHEIHKFLAAQTAKDCSIMISFGLDNKQLDGSTVQDNKKDCSQICLKDRNGRQYKCSIQVVDLDPKDHCKIPYYLKQDREIVNQYIRIIARDKWKKCG